ncbi:MAG: signal peptidase II [Deltaproteobacteria bacterium]
MVVRRGSFISVLLIAGGILALDRWTKHLAVEALSPGVSIPVFDNVFHLTLVHNRGAAFGFLPDAAFFFIFAALASIAGIAAAFLKPHLFERIFGVGVTDARVRTALALILGGAAGNLVDRCRAGTVVDFLDFRIWPVFNFADTAITCGGLLLALAMVCEARRPDGSRTL